MELLTILVITVIILAAIVWFRARVFIAKHFSKYNKFLHISDFHHLRELKSHEEVDVSQKAHEHHRNVKIAVLVIISALLILLSQRLY